MIKHTRTTIGTKPLAAIVAEFAADFAKPPTPQPPDDRPGWIESTKLMEMMGVSRSQFERFIYPRVKQKIYESGRGTKINRRGGLNIATYYRKVDAPKAC